MIEQIQDELVEIRPGRKIFVRHWILNSSSSNSSSTMNLVCVHGTAASQEQYLPFWKALDGLLASSSSGQKIHAWAYDAIGCGKSPKLDSSTAYQDEEQVQDLKVLLENHVDSSQKTYLVGHSYGPTWIYKYLLLQSSPSSPNTLSIGGLILICSGLRCNELVVGGPKLFQYAPLWLLNCLQPILTATFLKIGFSPNTHREQPELIAQAKLANKENDMQTCVYYYRAHDWMAQELDLPFATKVLHGTDDEVIPIHCGQALANHLKTPLISIPNASHMVLLEQPQVVAEHVLAFWNESKSSSTTTTTTT